MLTAAAAQFSRPFAAALCSLAMISGAGAWAQDAAPRGPGEGGGLSAMGAPAGPGVGARDGGFPESGDHSEAPVIAAPSDPGRWAPSPSSGYVPSEMGGFNSFAAGDAAPPPLPEHYGFNPDALPVVVELFTSQGCSSCPPADAMLAGLLDQPDILPLSFHVDYWDYLGWADSFARPEFTQRQERYAMAAGERSVYTPQVIVDGQDTVVMLGPAQLTQLIDASRLSPATISIRRDTTPKGEMIELMPLSDLGGSVDILLVRYAPERQVSMTAGENRGKVVTYTNVVLSLDRLAEWDGIAALRVTVSPDGTADDRFPDDTRHALLVQKERDKDLPGPILAAIRLD
ncbi:thioredoxin family protein [uncultured Paracoccus sp.]|uniref:DUF1223 domain-containing protein n=1 Tax=uncultured Paracoccus sp. TaxID=189685 RepID=UPI0025D12B81|nr:DUF1223 domain-containing protein [uncultured Paracoccus sp.]